MTTWTTVSSLDAPSAGVFDFPSLTLTGYQVLQVVISGVTVTTDGTDMVITFYVGGSEISTGYRWGCQAASSDASGADDGDAAAGGVLLVSNNANLDVGNDVGEGFGALVIVDNPLSTALHKKATYQSVATSPAGKIIMTIGEGLMENTGAIGGLKVWGSSALTAGKVRVLGMA